MRVDTLAEHDHRRLEERSPVIDGCLLVITHVEIRAFQGQHFLHAGFGKHLDALAARFRDVEMLTCLRHVDDRPNDYVLEATNVSVTPLRPIAWSRSRLRRLTSMLVTAFQAAALLPRLIGKADVVHPRLPSPVGIVGGLYGKLGNRPVFYYLSTDWEESLLSRGPTRARRAVASMIHDLFCYLMTGCVSFVSGNRLAHRFADVEGVIAPVMPTVLDASDVVSESVAVERVRSKPSRLLFVGKVWREKGVHILLNALRSLIDEGFELQLRVVGALDDRDEWFRHEVDSRELGPYVTHVPHMSWRNLLAEYDEADVFVMPSLEGRGETGPKVVLEAMARGVPVIASRVGFVSDVIRSGENGLIVEANSPEAIVDAVRSLLQSIDLRLRLAVEGVRTAQEFQLDVLADRMAGEILNQFPTLTAKPTDSP